MYDFNYQQICRISSVYTLAADLMFQIVFVIWIRWTNNFVCVVTEQPSNVIDSLKETANKAVDNFKNSSQDLGDQAESLKVRSQRAICIVHLL